MSDLDYLLARIMQLEKKVEQTPTFRWGVVTGTNPLAVQLDASDAPLAGKVDTLVSGLVVGDRVQVLWQNRRAVVIGRGQGERPQKILASGNSFMNAATTWTLSERISEQTTGIVLIFSAYSSGGATNQWSSHFVPKEAVNAAGSGFGWVFRLGLAGDVGKYIYISDTHIAGYASNDAAPNNTQALRYVIGV